jgi:2-polyprenyl-3-methyl-5-hydroxy-6-metoxy-1,4-benzoquinol methylase
MEPQKKELLDHYGDTHQPDLTPNEAKLAHAYFREHYDPWLPANQEAEILDLGCGRGHLLDWLKSAGYNRISGVDASPPMVAATRARGHQVVCADAAQTLADRTGQYDLIYALDIIEHLERNRVLEFLKRCRSALRPSGKLVLITVNADALGWGRIMHGDFTHESAFTATSLSQLLRAAGFRHIEFRESSIPREAPNSFRRKVARAICRLAFGIYRHGASGDGVLASGSILTEEILVKAAE